MSKELTYHCTIAAPVEHVFERFSDIPSTAGVISGIESVEMLTDGPVGVGTRFRETRVMFGKEATEEMEFTEYQPPHHYVVEARSHGAHYVSSFDFKSINNGTDVTLTFSATPETVMAKIMSVIMGPMMRKSVSKCLTEDMTDMKAAIEAAEQSKQ